jgi:hypothetical protein
MPKHYSSTRDRLVFYLYIIYLGGMQNPIDLGFTNIIKPHVDALVGLSFIWPDLQSVHRLFNTVAEEKLQSCCQVIQMDRVMRRIYVILCRTAHWKERDYWLNNHAGKTTNRLECSAATI